jgi:hypothetical protein
VLNYSNFEKEAEKGEKKGCHSRAGAEQSPKPGKRRF